MRLSVLNVQLFLFLQDPLQARKSLKTIDANTSRRVVALVTGGVSRIAFAVSTLALSADVDGISVHNQVHCFSPSL